MNTAPEFGSANELRALTCSALTARDLAAGSQRLIVRPVLHPLAATAHIRMYSRNVCEFMLSGIAQERLRCPHGSIGEWLWIREPLSIAGNGVSYLADQEDIDSRMTTEDFQKQWQSALSMPMDLSRTSIQLQSIRVRRIREMSIDEVIADGLPPQLAMEAIEQGREEEAVLGHLTKHYEQSVIDENRWVWLLGIRVVSANISDLKLAHPADDLHSSALKRVH